MLRKYAGSLIMLMVRVGSSLAVNKLFAFFLGTPGITSLAHLQNLFSIATLVPAEGIGKGLVKYIADRGVNKDLRRDFIVAGFIWHLLIWLISSLTFLILINHFFKIFPSQWSTFQWFIMVSAALIGQLLYLFSGAILLASHKIKLYLISQIAASALVLVCVIIAVSSKNLSFTLLGFAAGQGLSIAIIIIVLQLKHISVAEVWEGLWQYVHQAMQHSQFVRAFVVLGKYSLMALSVVIFGKTVDFFVRQFAVNEFGIQATGLWQAVVRTSELYTQIFTALIGVVYFPRIAAVIGQKEELNKVLRQAIMYWLPLILLGLIGIYLTRFHILYLIFDNSFLEGAVFFKWQLSGDFFIMISYFFAYILLGKAHIRLFIMLQAISAVLYIVAVSFLYQYQGIEAFALAYFIRSAGYAICLIIFTTKDL